MVFDTFSKIFVLVFCGTSLSTTSFLASAVNLMSVLVSSSVIAANELQVSFS
jgi:hypothetical protein